MHHSDSQDFTSAIWSLCLVNKTLQWENSAQQTVTVWGKGPGSMVHGSMCVSIYARILVYAHTDKSRTPPTLTPVWHSKGPF